MTAAIGRPGGTPERPALFFTGPEEFRAWLAANHDSAPELWMGLHKKGSGGGGLTWAEAVPEALCFGWIDSVFQPIDDATRRQRWTPRKRGSTWSAVNIAHVERLLAEGRMQPAGIAAFEARREDRSGIYSYEQQHPGQLPPAYAEQLAAEPRAARFLELATASYRRQAVHWVLSAKQEATRERRLAELIAVSASGRLIKQARYGTEPGWVARARAALGTSLAVVMAVLGGCTTAGSTATSSATQGSSASAGGGASSVGPAAPPSSTPPAPTWVAAENAKPGDKGWNVGTSRVAPEGTLDGYADATSVRPGDPVTLRISSTRGPVTVSAYRLGWYAGVGGRRVWSGATTTAVTQDPASVHTAGDGMVSADWRPSLTVDTTGWPEGSYLFRLDAGGKAKVVPLTVRSASTAGRIVVINSVTTYQAYNRWGGASLYLGPDRTFGTRAKRVSFDRPYDGNGAPILIKHELDAIQWLEKQNADLAYATSIDLGREPGLLDGARAMISLGHDEYWSVPEREAVEKARDAGTNLAFLGANAVYWRVRLSADGRQMTGTKDAALDPGHGAATTAMWRSAPDPRPENSLTGMLYECFPALGALVVTDPSFFLFRNTGARAGSRYPGLVGTEIDRAYPIAGTPANLHVAAHSPVTCGGTQRGTHSDLTYYTAPSGAGVVATGSMLFERALRGAEPKFGITEESADFARTVLANLVGAMAVGPMADHFPAQGNLAQFEAPVTTTTGTGGAVATS